MKRTRFWSDISCSQNQQKQVFEVFFMSTKWNTYFWSVSMFIKQTKNVFERFHVYNMKNLCLWSVFISNIVMILQKNNIYQCIIQKNSHLFWKQENLLQSRKIVTLTWFCQLQHKKSLFQILSLPDEKVTFFIKCHWKKMSLSLKNVTLKQS